MARLEVEEIVALEPDEGFLPWYVSWSGVFVGALEVRRRAQAAREAARSLVKQSAQPHVRSIAQLVTEAEAALYALRDTIRQAPTRSGTKLPGRQIRPVHLSSGQKLA